MPPRSSNPPVAGSLILPGAPADEYGVPFHIFYGVSNNARTFWSITNARRVIGYEPQDDSEVRFAEDIARLLHGRT